MFCKRESLVLILDTTFRFFSKRQYNEYNILLETGLDFVVIEDTGKTFPTLDLKVSMMVYSKAIAKEIRLLYEEIYLCTSKISLSLLSELIKITSDKGLNNVIWKDVQYRKQRLIQAIKGTGLQLVESENTCDLPIVWLNIKETNLSDIELYSYLEKFDVFVLPGRMFYWNSPLKNQFFIRMSLFIPRQAFEIGLNKLSFALRKL